MCFVQEENLFKENGRKQIGNEPQRSLQSHFLTAFALKLRLTKNMDKICPLPPSGFSTRWM